MTRAIANFAHLLGVQGLDTPEIVNAALGGFLTDVQESQVPQLRADAAQKQSLPSADAQVETTRAAVRGFVARQRRLVELHADANDITDDRQHQIEDAILEQLGYRAVNGVVSNPGMRADSHYFVEALSAPATSLIRPNEREEMVRTAIPTRNVPTYAEYFNRDYLSESGEAAIIHGDQSSGFNRVGYDLRREKGRMHWIGVSTYTSWESAFRSAAMSAVDDASEQARLARRAIERKHEEVLITGVANLKLMGLANLPAPRILSSVDFSTATIGEKATEMTRILQKIRQAADFAGAVPSVGLLDPRLAFTLRNANNLDAGGNIVGSGPLLQAMSNEGLRQVVEAPTMQQHWASPRGANYAQMIIFAPAANGRLEKVVGLGATPVSTSQNHGTETLYAARIGGLDAGDVSSIAVIDIKVA